MLIATLSCSRLEIIQPQREDQQKNITKVERCCLCCKCWGHWHRHLLTDSLQSVFSINRMWLKWN